MRRLLLLAALSVGCAHTALPPYGTELRFVRSDRDSVSGPKVLLTRTSDGNWRGWTCGIGLAKSCPTQIDVTPAALVIGQIRVPVQIEGASVTFREAHVDLVFRRVDGGPIPLEAAVPLWIATQFDTWSGVPGRVWWSPSRECFQVRGLGMVELSVVRTGTSPDGPGCAGSPEPLTASL